MQAGQSEVQMPVQWSFEIGHMRSAKNSINKR